MAKGIYKFEKEIGEDNIIIGQFVADSLDIQNLDWQKFDYADWHHMIEPGDIELQTNDPKAVALYEKFNLQVGFNPLEDITDDR